MGPNWDMEKICAVTDEALCTAVGPMKDYGFQPMGLKLEDHMNQIATIKRFQPYVSDWTADTQQEGALYDLEGIDSVPISLIVGENDQICPASTATDLAARLSTLQNHITLLGADHETFDSSNQPDYFNLLLEEITSETVIGEMKAKSVQLADTSATSTEQTDVTDTSENATGLPDGLGFNVSSS